MNLWCLLPARVRVWRAQRRIDRHYREAVTERTKRYASELDSGTATVHELRRREGL